ncbi:hypothetical protein J1N35_044262 [Gossypium stocksii]|uniref:Uncharacterized protein n=1 Tax=Gossypium stocksii TaxID=47602 RepID=A0A9D3U956_9ROSI|nr:hypothetical protein J1N35_044262 [Gossypium stocksii]
MTQLFYLLGLNNNLKPVILASTPYPLAKKRRHFKKSIFQRRKFFETSRKWKPKWRYLRRKKSLQDSSIYMMDAMQAQEDQHQIDAKDTIPVPQVLVKIYLDKYSKPVTVIAFFDTGAAATIMNPDVLPLEWWKPHTTFFNIAANYPFATYLKTTQLGSFPTAWVHRIYPDEVTYSNNEYRSLQKYLFPLNRMIPFEILPPPNIDASWDTVPDGPYYQQILQAL